MFEWVGYELAMSWRSLRGLFFRKYFENIVKKIENLASFMLFLTYFQIFQLFFDLLPNFSAIFVQNTKTYRYQRKIAKISTPPK